jgi:superfamily II DNA or RNA helicase
MAGRERTMHELVQVASVQTVWSRAVKQNKMPLPPADLLVIDECHKSLSATYLHLIERYTEMGATILGMTATPCRGDGRGLGHVYEDMIRCPPIKVLTEQGFLVPIKYYAPSAPDLTGVKVRMGDYVEKELTGRMEPLIGSIVENWARLAEGRPTVVFATGVRHSIHLRDEFEKAGVAAAHMDGKTPDLEREEILKNLWEGRIDVLCNCMVLTEGWDCPPVSCCVLARPTKSIGLYVQMAGRTLRPWDGKDDCLLIDHSGAVYEHGFIHDEIPWDLDQNGKIQTKIQGQKKKKESKPITCPECKHIFQALAECPECGWKPQTTGKEYEWIRGELVEVDKEVVVKFSTAMQKKWFGELIGLCDERGYKPGWVPHTFKKKFGHWPMSEWSKEPRWAGPEVRAFCRHLQIRYAKGMEKKKKREKVVEGLEDAPTVNELYRMERVDD